MTFAHAFLAIGLTLAPSAHAASCPSGDVGRMCKAIVAAESAPCNGLEDDHRYICEAFATHSPSECGPIKDPYADKACTTLGAKTPSASSCPYSSTDAGKLRRAIIGGDYNKCRGSTKIDVCAAMAKGTAKANEVLAQRAREAAMVAATDDSSS